MKPKNLAAGIDKNVQQHMTSGKSKTGFRLQSVDQMNQNMARQCDIKCFPSHQTLLASIVQKIVLSQQMILDNIFACQLELLFT